MNTHLAACFLVLLPLRALAHDSHDHAEVAPAANTETVVVAAAKPSESEEALTGSGDFKFRYSAELSVLPPEIQAGITRAHGGFAKTPSGEIYFGLEGTGMIRVSADLRTKKILSKTKQIIQGGLHNTTYLEHAGGTLAMPDNAHGKIHFLTLEGKEAGELGRPDVNDYYREGKPFNPTDTAFGSNGIFYINDGYSAGKYVLKADLDTMTYLPEYFGGPVPGEGRTETKFSTNHGITAGEKGVLYISDRERQWVQKVDLDGKFLGSIELTDANPCDVDFVQWKGEKLTVVGCLSTVSPGPGVVKLVRGDKVVSTLSPKVDLGIETFQHIHNAAGVVVDGKLYILCYGWNPGCYAVLEHVTE